MNDSIIPAKFDFQGNNVRIVMRDGEPWFVASDICKALEYSNPSKAIADHLDTDERYNQPLERGGSLLVINESGLYALVLRSRKPEARKFAKWVTNEVLPSIRKTGHYALGQQQELSIAPATTRSTTDLARIYHTASQAGAKLQEAVYLELVKCGSELNGRMMITLDEGNPRIKFVDGHAYVMPIEGFANAIYDCINISPDVLAQINTACTTRLKEMAAVARTKPKLEPELRRALT